MYEAQQMVLEFHKEFDIHVANAPTVPDGKTQALRVRLIQEEFDELQEAFEAFEFWISGLFRISIFRFRVGGEGKAANRFNGYSRGF